MNPGPFDYHSTHYHLLTDDKRSELAKQRARRKLEKAFIDRFSANIYESTRRLTDSQLSRIIGILEEGKDGVLR